MLLADERRRDVASGVPLGHAHPRIAPPVPARHRGKEFADLAAKLGTELYPWQQTAARYLTAVGTEDRWLYPEVALVVGRQNGKTEMLVPLIVARMLDGQRVMHTAQNAKLPREVHDRIATIFLDDYPELIPSKRAISYALGDEKIKLTNGAYYRIVPPTKSGARGPSVDLLLIDELREMEDFDFIAASEPTTSARPNPQIIYLSNAGTEDSIVLNSLKARADADPNLAYLEWSAAPERADDDREGWLEANPAIGHNPAKLRSLEREYLAYKLANQMAVFETEHLCRWVSSMKTMLVKPDDWKAQDFDPLERAQGGPVMAVKMDISGQRCSAVIAWLNDDKRVSLEVVADVVGSPIDVNLLGPELLKIASVNRVVMTGYDPYTDADLARHFRRAKAINGRDYANASEGFVRRANAHQFRVSDQLGILAADLVWTIRKSSTNGSYIAVRANNEHTNTAAEAAVRAAWLASAPIPIGPARIQ